MNRVNLAALQKRVDALAELLPGEKLTLEAWGRKYQLKVNGRCDFGTAWHTAKELFDRIDFAETALGLRNRYTRD